MRHFWPHALDCNTVSVIGKQQQNSFGNGKFIFWQQQTTGLQWITVAAKLASDYGKTTDARWCGDCLRIIFLRRVIFRITFLRLVSLRITFLCRVSLRITFLRLISLQITFMRRATLRNSRARGKRAEQIRVTRKARRTRGQSNRRANAFIEPTVHLRRRRKAAFEHAGQHKFF